MEYFDLDIRIPYADVDQMGVVYYANYLVYFERGRTEFLRAIGYDYKSIEDHYKLLLPVRNVQIEYNSPARYDDVITIRTFIKELKKASVYFTYTVMRNGEVLVTGSSKHVFINTAWKPTRIPKDLAKTMSKHIGNIPDGTS